MRILVVIVNYGRSQLKYLELMIKEFKSMTFNIDIVVHSNIPLPYEGIELKIEKLNNYNYLPFTTRKTIYERQNDYDLFIYSENDHLITQKNIESFLKVTKVLPDNYIAGFMQYEKYNGKLFYPAYHGNFGWEEDSAFKIEEYIFAHFNNVHQGSYVITRKQLHQIREKLTTRYYFKYPTLISLIFRLQNLYKYYLKRFNSVIIKQIDRLIKKIVLENFKFRFDIFKIRHDERCRAGTDIYTHCGFRKVIPISHFDDFLIYHMPNIYLNRLGKFDEIMRKDISKIINKVKHR